MPIPILPGSRLPTIADLLASELGPLLQGGTLPGDPSAGISSQSFGPLLPVIQQVASSLNVDPLQLVLAVMKGQNVTIPPGPRSAGQRPAPTPTAAPAPAARPTSSGTQPKTATQPATAQSMPTAGAAQQGQPGRFKSFIGNLIANAPALPPRALPEQQGRGALAALPQLGAAISNAFGGAALANQQKAELGLAKEEAAQRKLESEARIKAAESEQRERAFALNARKADQLASQKELEALQTPNVRAQLIKEHATAEEMMADLEAGRFEEYNRKMGLYTAANEAKIRVEAEGVLKNPEIVKAFAINSLDDAVDFVRAQDSIAKGQQILASRASIEADQARMEQLRESAKLDKAGALAQVVHFRDAALEDAQKAKTQLEQTKVLQRMWDLAQDPARPEEERKRLQLGLMQAGITTRPDTTADEANVEANEARIGPFDSLLDSIDPSFRSTLPVPSEKTEIDFDAEIRKRLPGIAAPTGPAALSPEQEALSKEVGAVTPGVVSQTASGIYGVAASPFTAASRIAGGVSIGTRELLGQAGAYDREPEFLDTYARTKRELTALNDPTASALTPQEVKDIALHRYLSKHTMPSLAGPQNVAGIDDVRIGLIRTLILKAFQLPEFDPERARLMAEIARIQSQIKQPGR